MPVDFPDAPLRRVIYADLDAFLDRLGLVRRSIQVDHGQGVGEGNGLEHTAPDTASARRSIPPSPTITPRRARLMLPVGLSDEAVDPHYLHAARRTLVDWGVTSDEAFDRWLCRMRFPDIGGVPAGAGGRRVRAGGG
jgi:hypothetical protein